MCCPALLKLWACGGDLHRKNTIAPSRQTFEPLGGCWPSQLCFLPHLPGLLLISSALFLFLTPPFISHLKCISHLSGLLPAQAHRLSSSFPKSYFPKRTGCLPRGLWDPPAKHKVSPLLHHLLSCTSVHWPEGAAVVVVLILQPPPGAGPMSVSLTAIAPGPCSAPGTKYALDKCDLIGSGYKSLYDAR